jgi:Papain-like cysteine protease AvrRpt2
MIKNESNPILTMCLGIYSQEGGTAMPTLAFNMQPQTQKNWCWAAVVVSTHLFYGGNQWTMQCKLVDHELGLTSCCQNGSSPACNRCWRLHKALQTTGNFRHFTRQPESWNVVTQQITSQRPLGVRIELPGNRGHFLIVSGCITTPAGHQNVVVQDPWFGSTTVRYAALVSGYQGGRWTDSFFTQ